jgi:hypothetical protein
MVVGLVLEGLARLFLVLVVLLARSLKVTMMSVSKVSFLCGVLG